jgi:FkbM family methyltransferase
VDTNTLAESWNLARGRGKQAVARLARRVLPGASLTLRHVEPGVKLTVNLRRHVMFWSGGLARFEPFTVRVLRAAVEPGDTVFDVGANIGFFATLLSRWAGPDGRVFAFEPEPANLGMLRGNLEANDCDNVRVVPCALGAEPGAATFSLDEATGSTGRLGGTKTAGELAVGSGKLSLMETRVETIDALCARDGLIPDVIKMDIEGSEIYALTGARLTLDEHRPVVVSELAGDEGTLVLGLLYGRGYRFWNLETGEAVGAGPCPFMVVALPGESLETERAGRVLAALDDIASSRL